MDTEYLRGLEVVEIDGAEVFAGETIPVSLLFKVVSFVAAAATTAIIANWSDFKDGVFDGYNGATH